MQKTEFTLPECVQVTGKSLKTIYRHVQSGKLSTSQNSLNQKVVNLSELLRVYGSLRPINLENDISKNSQVPTHETETVQKLRTEIVQKNAEIDILKSKIEQKDEILLLTHQKAEIEQKSLLRQMTDIKQRTWLWIVIAIVLTALLVNVTWMIPGHKLAF
jgi:predicted DNA-binding transcriptional regulator AlpA